MSQALDLGRISKHAGREHSECPARPKLFFGRLDAWEAGIVRKVIRMSQGRVMYSAAVCVNYLGNGWLYAAVAAVWLVFAGPGAWRFGLAASISVGVSHLFYAFIKPRLARLRPGDFDPTLRSAVRALDKYSCPSGHCMTAAAVGVPLAVGASQAIPAIAAVWLLVAWSRLSLGHHYPTDIVLGTILGAGVSLAISAVVL